jgi:ABC-type siderophore export system fused ATPase/permease subunit
MRLIVLVTALLMGLFGRAQNNLSGGLQHSPHTYVYKIDKKEAERLQKTKLEKVNEKYLHTLVDSFASDVDVPDLKPGSLEMIAMCLCWCIPKRVS